MNIKILFLLVVSLFTLSTIYADTEYNYELEIDYDFDEDEEIVCELHLGNSKKTKTFDENDDRSDMTFEGRFDDSLEVDCDQRVDIDLRVLDLEDNEVDDIRESNVRSFIYELELYEGILSFNYDFDEDVDTLICELKKDEEIVEYSYNKADDDSLKEEIEFEFLREIEFECSERLDELRLEIEDPNGFDIYDLFLEDEDTVDFDENTPRHYYDLNIFFTKDFNEEEVECEVEIDSDSEFTLEFTDSSSGSDRNLDFVFGESFEITCDDTFDEALVDIILLEDDDVKVFQEDYTNQKSIRITVEDIENWEEDNEEEIEEEVREEKELIPEIVTIPDQVLEEEIEEEISDSSNTSTPITSSNQEEIIIDINSSTSPINQSQEIPTTPTESNSISIIHGFIAVVSLILVIAIVVLVVKL